MLIRRFSLNPGDDAPGTSRRWTRWTHVAVQEDGVVAHRQHRHVRRPRLERQLRQGLPARGPQFGRCLSRGDSVLVQRGPPPGRTTASDLVRDHLRGAEQRRGRLPTRICSWRPGHGGNFAPCGAFPSIPSPARTLNNKSLNLTPRPGRAHLGPDREPRARGVVVPNPLPRQRGRGISPATNEVHFINLPARATIKIYTVAGDLVRELDAHRPGPRLRALGSQERRAAATSPPASTCTGSRPSTFTFQDRFVVIR